MTMLIAGMAIGVAIAAAVLGFIFWAYARLPDGTDDTQGPPQ